MKNDTQNKLVELIGEARNILVFTGAGVSTGSGIPDFRGPQGVWQTRQPVYYQDFMTSERSRIEYWDYKLEGWEGFRDAKPNAVHKAIARLEEVGKLRMLVTQNIDGLHSRAGVSDEKIIELHGSNLKVECQSCGELTDPEAHFEYFRKLRLPPTCHCSGYLKPATISFGQSLRDGDIQSAFAAASDSDLVFALGSTLMVYPAANVPLAAVKAGAKYVIINSGDTDHDKLSGINLRLEDDVNEVFPPAVEKAIADF